MSYLHCHNCEFSQDDFWDFRFAKYAYWHHWRYNPFSLFLSYFGTYWRPRRTKFDRWIAKENGWSRSDPHSWYLIWHEFKRMIRKFIYQKYWTAKSWQRAIKKNGEKWPACPKCGKNELDID